MLNNQYAVITGCNRGIGKAILENFARNRANIFAVIRKNNSSFSHYVDQLMRQYNINIKIFEADFSDEAQVTECAKKILKEKKTIHVLVNNVGIALPQNSFLLTKSQTIKNVFQINFHSPMIFTQTIARNMMRQGGSIIFLSSSAAYDGGGNVEYSASKAAIIGEVHRLAVEFGQLKIRVNAVAPGLTDTDMADTLSEEDQALALKMNIMQRKGKPEEIANVVTFLASDLSSFITSQVIRVDGGLR